MPSDLNPQPLPPRATTIYAAREVMYDLDKFQRALASVLDRAGHGGCTSGLHWTGCSSSSSSSTTSSKGATPFHERAIGFGG